ncbi:hypothetical protein ACS0TY_029514 [Phlomoides rotata]
MDKLISSFTIHSITVAVYDIAYQEPCNCIQTHAVILDWMDNRMTGFSILIGISIQVSVDGDFNIALLKLNFGVDMARCQRSSNCPMCWQNISLKDLARVLSNLSFILVCYIILFLIYVEIKFIFYYNCIQELLEAVERERSFRFTPSRNAIIFRHPTLGDFDYNIAEIEDLIIQYLVVAAAMGKTHQVTRREDTRSHSSAHARPQYVVFSTHSIETSTETKNNISVPSTSVNNIDTEHIPAFVQSNHIPASSFRSSVTPTSSRGLLNDNRNYMNQSSSLSQDKAGPSEFRSFPDT